ncbi:MAG: isoleucine--tRNA ligase [Elusimicrobiota bacterium]|jgi:isoleucyl-tRNA synthetase|nr:isoleucine--tRNA ligase [Elusimicrobiota bacterium]
MNKKENDVKVKNKSGQEKQKETLDCKSADNKVKDKKDFSATVNLPHTDFPMKANLPQTEPQFVKFWQDQNIYQKISEKNCHKEKFIFHDGPPYANAHIHIGTALNRVLKDFIIKYRSMAGQYVPYTPGWDCHGLPIEQLALKELKTDKNKVDTLVFRKQAADFARKFVGIQKEEFKRLGAFADWDHPYLTLLPSYEKSILELFAILVEKNFVYRKIKPVLWCTNCQTALADAEVEYADHVTKSIFVKFDLVELPKNLVNKANVLENFSVLIWTTTPWTLPSNSGLAFNAEADYIAAVFNFSDGRKEKLIVAKELAKKVHENIGAADFEIIETIKGADFLGILCHNPLENIDRLSKGILADFVSLEDGTGIVHIAPGHGQEDYEAGLAYNLEIISPVNDKGLFTKDVAEYENMHVFKASDLIVERLEKAGKVLAVHTLKHSYPHCWRCKKPVIFRATPQWFISIDHNDLRQELLDDAAGVNWIPKYGQNRISGMLASRPDWCVSRQRLWGVPIPVFYCKDCNEPLLDSNLIKKIAKLFGEKGSDCWFEMSEKELLSEDFPKCKKCGGVSFRKEEDILDVWFDSGASWKAVLESGNYKDLSFPADLYLEGSDQHRGWFHTSLILSAACQGVAPYRNVLTHGFVVDGQGRKMSKSLGNGIDSQTLVNQHGADILRLWVASSDYREDIRISDEILKGLSDSYRKIRNTIRFLLGNLNGFSVSQKLPFEQMAEIDKNALFVLDDVIEQANAAFKDYEFHKAAACINNFCTVFLSGFYLDALKDILYCGKRDDKNRLSACSAMFEILNVLVILCAPILSFTAEQAWDYIRKFLPDSPISVFLADYPIAKHKKDLAITEKWDTLLKAKQKVSVICEKLRQEKIIGSNMDAALTIEYGKKYDEAFKNKEDVCLAFGCWDIKLKKIEKADGLFIEAKKSELLKCARCWRHIEDVKDGLCKRCAEAVSEIK